MLLLIIINRPQRIPLLNIRYQGRPCFIKLFADFPTRFSHCRELSFLVMTKRRLCFHLLISLLFIWVEGGVLSYHEGEELPLTRIAFGSCANQSEPQAILDFDPQLFIWLGDNIYADKKRPTRIFGRERTYGPWKNAPRFWPASMNDMEQFIAQAKNKPGYAELRKRATIIGTWDDHDYGLDDSGKEFAEKNASQKLLLDFLDEPISSIRRVQEGVYASYTFGPLGKQIKVILLDTRYHRDPMLSEGTMLGEKQWTWLEQQLRGNEAQITIIGSSIQVLPNFSATVQPLFTVESWSHFSKERDRLFYVLEDTHVRINPPVETHNRPENIETSTLASDIIKLCSQARGVLFISGDVHFCEVTRYDCGISYAVAPAFSFLIRLAAWLTPSTMRIYSSNCRYRSCAYGKQNFGTLVINWDSKPVSIIGQVRDVNGDFVAQEKIMLSELQPRQTNDHIVLRGRRRHCTLEKDLPFFSKHLLAIVFVGTLFGISVVFLMCLYFAGTWLKKTMKRKLA